MEKPKKKEWSSKTQALVFLAFIALIVSPFAIGYYIEERSDKLADQQQEMKYKESKNLSDSKFTLGAKIRSYSKKFHYQSEEYKKLKQYEKQVDYCRDKEELYQLERKALTL